MRPRYPGPEQDNPGAHYGRPDLLRRTRDAPTAGVRQPLDLGERMARDRQRSLPALRRRRPGVAARFVAGPRLDDALRVAGEVVGAGRGVALDHVPSRSDDAADELAALAARVAAAGLAAWCELTVPVDRLGAAGARRVAAAAVGSGLAACLTGPAALVDDVAVALPAVRTAVPCGEPDAVARCRTLAGRDVRLVAGRGTAADLALVRCLNVLMPAAGSLAGAAADPRLVAVVGERAAWYDRPRDSWEHVMPYGVRTAEQQRLLAAGDRVRVAVPSGPGATGLVLRRLAGAA
jgi:proline dehydrogenase